MRVRVPGVLMLSAVLTTLATAAMAAHLAPAAPGPLTLAATTGAKPVTTVHHRRVHHRRPPPVGGVYARNAILLDPATGEVLFEKNSSRSVPIASLTKLMTAMVFLEQKPDLTREVEVTAGEILGAGHTQLRRGERVPLGELLHMSLMCSDNCATRVIALESGFPRPTSSRA